MAKDRGEFPNPQLFEIAAHEFRMGHAGEGIVDNGSAPLWMAYMAVPSFNAESSSQFRSLKWRSD